MPRSDGHLFLKAELEMENTWKDAIKRVLSESAKPLHASEIANEILARGYYSTEGATPVATVNAQISSSIKKDGEKSPFVRVAKSTFMLRGGIRPPEANGGSKENPENVSDVEVERSDSVIHSFGMYWKRDSVVWKNDPRLFGKQQATSKAVDFGHQKGIYILYDHHTVVYVGRSIDRPLGKRLFEHTIDRLGSRWNCFSWFGLLDVTEDGQLQEKPVSTSLATLIATLEALLIEALEPPQNRKRGDDFSSVEYIQSIDPELQEREIQNTLRAIEQRVRDGYAKKS